MPSLTGPDLFKSLSPQWEWNHNPDPTRFSVGFNGLVLQTTTVTSDLYSARNTLTHRIQGPISTATVKLVYSDMHDGDRAGLALLRDSSAWIGVKRDGGLFTIAFTTGLTMDGDNNWSTISTGNTTASARISGGTIWLRVTADVNPGLGKQGNFSYSTNGKTFTPLGSPFTMTDAWQFFLGYRFAIFNYATASLGGRIRVPLFQLDAGLGKRPVV
ncbi:hypothetical protein HGRIS_011439 [Hohenbuehelia grisea]|uniref:Beta-xylosidase C-terminal Concanavalin A-like domain-containing protein n=1 Tax=Hohenbuehelia grisea TaxID=104357 RepID=A0ABR3JV24_9AGAR